MHEHALSPAIVARVTARCGRPHPFDRLDAKRSALVVSPRLLVLHRRLRPVSCQGSYPLTAPSLKTWHIRVFWL